jgi:hypothetical protein
VKIGENTAKGNGNNEYLFTDAQPSNGVNYYRLKMVDDDNYFAYSKVIALTTNSSILSGSIRPNPFTSEVTISLVLTKAQHLKVALFDAAGREVKLKEADGFQGLNTLMLTELSNLPTGLYMVRITAGEQVIQQKLLKAGK